MSSKININKTNAKYLSHTPPFKYHYIEYKKVLTTLHQDRHNKLPRYARIVLDARSR